MYGRTRFERETGQLGVGREHEVIAVDESTRLERFLHRNRQWPQWRIAALVKCGAIEIAPPGGGARTRATSPRDRVEDGGSIHVADPLPAACAAAVTKPPPTAFRDYGIAPGKDGYQEALQWYLALRPQTVTLKSPASLAELKKALTDHDEVTAPVRHLLVGAHAHASGLLGLPMRPFGSIPTSASDLDTATGLELPPIVFDPRPEDPPGTPIPATVHVKGCRVGHSAAFLKALKKALGGKVVVTAPKHLHFFRRRPSTGKPVELWEYMSYEFEITSLSTLTRAEAIARWADPTNDFRLIAGRPGGTPPPTLPVATWEAWTPTRGWGSWKPRPKDHPGFSYLEIPVDVVHPITRKKETLNGVAAVRFEQRRVFGFADILGGTADPGTDERRRKRLRELFDKNPDQAKPVLERAGVKELDELMKLTWLFKKSGSGGDTKLSAELMRNLYTHMRPVVDPATNTLLMNLFPPPAKARTDPYQIVESDDRLFGTA